MSWGRRKNTLLVSSMTAMALVLTVSTNTFMIGKNLVHSAVGKSNRKGDSSNADVTAAADSSSSAKQLEYSVRDVDEKLYVVPSGESPVEARFVAEWKSFKTPGFRDIIKVKHVRGQRDFSRKLTCSSTEDVLKWLFSETRAFKDGLSLAYGELLHTQREGELMNSTDGVYFDDDIDVWIAPHVLANVIEREPYLFTSFGWSARIFVTGEYTVFAQLMAVCGYTQNTRIGKLKSESPAIELYPLAKLQVDGVACVKDLWQNTIITQHMIFPLIPFDLESNRYQSELQLQIPNGAISILTCLYGNWKAYSSRHAGWGKRCI